MNDLLSKLQLLGDAEHDDLSVAHDALAEIVRLRMLNAELIESLDDIHDLLEEGFSMSARLGLRALLTKAKERT